MNKLVFYFLILVTFFGCDEASDSYLNYQEAFNDRLFQRGWLPEFIPKSARNIKITSNLDINIAWGEFYFDISDLSEFVSKLEPYTKQSSRINDLDDFIAKMQSNNYDLYKYSLNQYTWVFACHQVRGHCKYKMW